MIKVIENIANRLEENKQRKIRHKQIKAHIKANRPTVEAMMEREKYYKQLLQERAERLSYQATLERKRVTEEILKEHYRKMNQQAR